MQTIFSSYAGPGVSARGVDQHTWADQTDNRPTLLALAGLHDDYAGDGRVLQEELAPDAVAPALSRNRTAVLEVGQLYKQLAAADGQFAMSTLAVSTRALASGSATDDRTYTRLEAALAGLDKLRDALTAEMSRALLGAAFENRPISTGEGVSLAVRGSLLLAASKALAAS
jgi:hypothetical protein